VDAQGRLISHPDIGLVLQNTDLSQFAQVRAALAETFARTELSVAENTQGIPVVVAYTTIAPLGWAVLVEQPRSEAFAALNASMLRTGLLLFMGLVLAVAASLALARRMVTPIRALQSGAARIGAGSLDHRIDVHTGDELETLADQFNRMAGQLQESYSGLEQKIQERTRQLELAGQAKSRFFAAASHDLRQPMHALGLFIAQLRNHVRTPTTREIVGQAEASVAAMRNLLDGLLDISKLDAGVFAPRIEDFSIQPLLQRMESGFGPAAREKGLKLRIVPSRLVVRSDPVLLERIVLNLVSNAVRYTTRGGIVVGCRRRNGGAHIEVWDSGMGIPADKQQDIFQEFFQLVNAERDRSRGLGLGLAIVERSALLGHRIMLRSMPGQDRCCHRAAAR
jgi:signal transduction histidine kinase